MKKYIIIFIAAIAMVMTSCNNDVDAGGTATQPTAGRWTVSLMQKSGNSWVDQADGLPIYTYNTAADVDSLMWLKDAKGLSDLTKLHADVNKLTFYSGVATSSGSSAYINQIEGSTSVTYKVINGAIFKGAAKTPSGLAADSIRYYIVCGTDTFKVAGFRYTGFPADEE